MQHKATVIAHGSQPLHKPQVASPPMRFPRVHLPQWVMDVIGWPVGATAVYVLLSFLHGDLNHYQFKPLMLYSIFQAGSALFFGAVYFRR